MRSADQLPRARLRAPPRGMHRASGPLLPGGRGWGGGGERGRRSAARRARHALACAAGFFALSLWVLWREQGALEEAAAAWRGEAEPVEVGGSYGYPLNEARGGFSDGFRPDALAAAAQAGEEEDDEGDERVRRLAVRCVTRCTLRCVRSRRGR